MKTVSAQGAICALIVAVAMAALSRPGHTADGERAVCIAVLDFRDLGPSVELEPLRRALARMLTTDLSSYAQIEVVARERVDRMIKETHLGESGLVAADTAQRAGRALAADYLVQGTFAAATGRIEVKLEVFDVAAGQVIGSEQVSGAADDVLAMEGKLLTAVAKALKLEQSKAAPAPKAGVKPVTLAVLYFQNLSPDAKLDPMEVGFADLLITYLQDRKGIAVVEREQLNKVLEELGLQKSALADSAPQPKIGQMLGAQVMLLGSFLVVKDTIRFDAHLVAADTGALMQAVSAHGPTSDVDAPLRALADRIAIALAAAPRATALPETKSKTSVEAMLHYSRGERLYGDMRFAEAAEEFERSLFLDPDNPRTMYDLIYAYRQLNRNDKAAEVIERLVRLGDEEAAIFSGWLADCYLKQGRKNEALGILQHAWELIRADTKHQGYMSIVHGMISANKALGRAEEAKRWYRLGIDTAPRVGERAWLRMQLAEMVRKSDLEEAKRQYEAMLADASRANPEERRQLICLGVQYLSSCYSRDREWKRAQRVFGAVIRELPGTPDAGLASFQLAAVAAACGHEKEAANLFVFAADTWPDLDVAPSALLEAAQLYSKLGDTQRAAELHRRIALRYGSHDWRTRFVQAPLGPGFAPGGPRPFLLGQAHYESTLGDYNVGWDQFYLRRQLIKRGFQVHACSDTVSHRVFADYSLAIFNCGKAGFTATELEALRSFVATGGGLLVNFDGKSQQISAYAQLISVLGIGPVTPAPSRWTTSPPFATLNPKRTALRDAPAPYIDSGPHIAAPAEMVVATRAGNTVVAAFTYGLGRVVVSGLGYGLCDGVLSGLTASDLYPLSATSANRAFLDDTVDWLRATDDHNTTRAAFESTYRKLAMDDVSGALSALHNIAAGNKGTRWAEEAQLLAAGILRDRGDAQAAAAEYSGLLRSAKQQDVCEIARLNLDRFHAASGGTGLKLAVDECWALWRGHGASPWASIALSEAGRWLYDAKDFAGAQQAFEAIMNSRDKGSEKLVFSNR